MDSQMKRELHTQKILNETKLVLKNQDTPLVNLRLVELQSSYRDIISYDLYVTDICCNNSRKFPLELRNLDLTEIQTNFNKWLERREASRERANSDWIKRLAGDKHGRFGFLDVGRGLSLNDTFWIVPANSDAEWNDWSPYRNVMDSEVSLFSFSHGASACTKP